MQFSSTVREPGWGLFPNGWVGEVLRYIVDVWQRLRLPSGVKLEPRITKLFAGAIRKRYESEGRDWFATVEDPDWDPSGKETSRTDIRLYPPGKKRHDICFVFESKCLNKPQSNASKYVGKDGMMCFITGKYSAGLPCAGMLGYVMDGKVPRAHKAICKAIKKKHKALRLAANGEYQSSTVLGQRKWHGETTHDLLDGKFKIYHLLLTVRRKPNSV